MSTSARRRLLLAVLAGYAAGYAGAAARLVRQRDAARHAADHDALTGLPNRRAAIDHLDRRLATGRSWLVALADLDDFKTINDAHGHLVGDLVLCSVADRLRGAVPAAGMAARLGGDEFLLVLPLPADAGARLRRLRADVVGPCPAGDHPQVGVSVGATVTTAGDTGWGQVVARCDIALYRAKTTGAGVAVYDPALDPPPARVPDARPRTRRRDRPAPADRPSPHH